MDKRHSDKEWVKQMQHLRKIKSDGVKVHEEEYNQLQERMRKSGNNLHNKKLLQNPSEGMFIAQLVVEYFFLSHL